MRISPLKNWPAKSVISMACGAVVISAGCDTGGNADRHIREAVDKARVARVKGQEGLAEAQSLLSKAATDVADAAPSTRAHAKVMLANAEMDSARSRISNPDSGIQRGNREIARLMWEIAQLGKQIQTSNNLVKSYRKFEPADAIKAAQQQVQAASGGAGAAVWVEGPDSAIPTLTAAQQQAQQLQQQIAQLTQQIQAHQAQQQQLMRQAEQIAQQASTMQGRTALAPYAQAADLRKQAADSQNRGGGEAGG